MKESKKLDEENYPENYPENHWFDKRESCNIKKGNSPDIQKQFTASLPRWPQNNQDVVTCNKNI